MIGQTISHYRILEKLGEGGMGVVYKAQDTKLHRSVAIKVLPSRTLMSETDRIRFAHEAEAAASLSHPNIAMIHEFDEIEGQSFIVMEFVDGETVKQKVLERPLPITNAIEIAMAVAEGLAKAHEKGIVHRDIKSENVMISRDGVVKIMDFGLAEIAGRSRVTKEGMTVGTTAYMSPEQARGEKIDQRTDIWSLGVVLYEMITGKPPYAGEYDTAVVYQIVNEEPEPITSLRSNVPMELERIVNKAMKKNPDERYRHADEMLTDLRLLGKTVEEGMRKEPRRPFLQKKNQIYKFVGAMLMLIILIVAGVRFFGGDSAAITSLAVLPLSNLSGDTEQEYFSDGMTEALITDLAKIGPLRVISRTSIMRYKSTKKSLPEIGRELDVDAIVEGSVMREQDRVRITVQLIHAPTDKHLWAESYERDLRDVLGLQREVARTIAQEIKLKLSPQQEARLTTARSVDPLAHVAYLKGLSHCRKLGTADKGIEHLKEAIELDPTFAPAHSALGGCYANLGYFGILPPQQAFLSAKSAALKAIELDPMLADAHRVVAFVQLSYEWDWAGAERDFKLALELNPNDAATHHSYAHYLLAMGREEESVAESRRATELDPLNPTLTSCVGWHSLYARRFDNAVKHSLLALELDPNNFMAHYYLGYAYEQQGKLEEAVAEFQSSITSFGGTPLGLAGLARAYARAGKRTEARKVLEELHARSKKGYVSAYEIAAVHNGLGDRNKTFDWLEKAYDERSSLLVHVNWDPRFENLQTDPRFVDLLHRMKFPQR